MKYEMYWRYSHDQERILTMWMNVIFTDLVFILVKPQELGVFAVTTFAAVLYGIVRCCILFVMYQH